MMLLMMMLMAITPHVRKHVVRWQVPSRCSRQLRWCDYSGGLNVSQAAVRACVHAKKQSTAGAIGAPAGHEKACA